MSETQEALRPERARPEDAQALSELARRAYEHYVPIMNAIPVPMSADYGAMIRDHETWVLRSGDRISACLVLIHAGDHLMIENIAVDPRTQGSGYGKLLLALAERRARETGYRELRLYTNYLMSRNREWYARSGFAETREEQRGDKRVVHMSKQLPDDK